MEKEKIVKGLNLNQWIEKETSLRKARLWGDDVEFSPVLCETTLGDGQQLVYLGTIGQRPYCWLIRIDSKTDITSDEFNFEEILCPLEEEFGRQQDLIELEEFEKLKYEGDEECVICETYEHWLECNWNYPCIGWDGGHWGLIVNMITGETD